MEFREQCPNSLTKLLIWMGLNRDHKLIFPCIINMQPFSTHIAQYYDIHSPIHQSIPYASSVVTPKIPQRRWSHGMPWSCQKLGEFYCPCSSRVSYWWEWSLYSVYMYIYGYVSKWGKPLNSLEIRVHVEVINFRSSKSSAKQRLDFDSKKKVSTSTDSWNPLGSVCLARTRLKQDLRLSKSFRLIKRKHFISQQKPHIWKKLTVNRQTHVQVWKSCTYR